MSGIFKKFRKDDIEITPFEAHKEYLVYVVNYTGSYYEKNYEQSVLTDHWKTGSTFNLPITNTIKSMSVYSYESQYDGSDFMPNEYGSYLQITSSSPHAVTTNNFYKRSMHDSIQGMYYTNPDDPCWTLDNNGYEKEIRTLASSSYIISIPQKMFGESIKKGSLKIQSGSTTLVDDTYGNLIDCSLYITAASESINYISQSIFAMNFTDMYNQHNKKISAHSINALASSSYYRDNGKEYYNLKNTTRFFERSPYPNRVEGHSITPDTSSTTEQTFINFNGLKPTTTESRMNIENSSMLKVKHRHQFDFRVGKQEVNTSADDFSIYIRVSASRFQEVITDDGTDNYYHNDIIGKFDPNKKAAVPFSIRYIARNAPSSSVAGFHLAGPGTYQAMISDGVSTLYLNSALVVSESNTFNNIILTKSGSHAYLYVDGALQSQGSIPSGSKYNRGDITIGSRPYDPGTKYRRRRKASRYSRKFDNSIEYKNHLKGGLSQVMMWNKNLTVQEVNFVNNNPTFENKVGNVFYHHGIITLTSPSAGYSTAINHIFSECTMSFKNTHTIIEHEYNCHIKEREYGFTMNPTIMDDHKLNTIKTFTTQSTWAPYVTTIGLYDNSARLLAVGKLSRAIKKSPLYDTTFVVGFDT